ncbi:MAG: tRNA lysidine(34) synthetase TilS [Oscillospiraceae bacterium]|nr:tRNA lysidine(34) synthetase TilS [Oscillospiraceae bacterium]
MKDKVASALSRLLPDGAVLYCACSGGADSAALLCVLKELSERGGFTLRAAHYNHQLRGEASDADEALVRDLCSRLDVPLTVERGDVRARAENSDDSLEEAARRMRYAFFDRLPGYVATAHTADDNLETFLINLIRGTSLAGLAGIPPVRDRILRPMLAVTHEEALAYLASRGIAHATDESNASRSFLRNRIRMDLVPLLQRENPRILEQTLAMTGLLREDEAWLSGCAA